MANFPERPTEEQQLVDRVVSGDSDAQSLFFDRFLKELQYLSQLHQYPEILDDIYIYLRANEWHRLRSWNGRLSLSEYVRLVAANVIQRRIISQVTETSELRQLIEDQGRPSAKADFTVAFAPELSPEQITPALEALADYYRACGGIGFVIDFEFQTVAIEEPDYVE